MRVLVPALLALSLLAACTTSAPEKSSASAPEQAPSSQPSSQGHSAAPDQAQIAARVKGAYERLEAQGQAGGMIRESIDFHGGLQRWYSNGPLAFRFRYEPLEEGKPARDTWQAIDTWSSKARHQVWENRSLEFGWDGEEAWTIGDPSGMGTNPRFWALTPYYFVALPFVLADPGVRLHSQGQASFEGKTYDLVKATFAPGTGDAPDDYYLAFLDPETRRLAAVVYIVTYKGFFPNGGHSPEKLMVFDGVREVQGIKLAQSLRSFSWTEQGAGEQVTRSLFEEVTFRPDLGSAWFARPENAQVMETY